MDGSTSIPQKDDDWSPFLSGLLSGSAMLCEQDERRTELLSFAMPRFAEVVWGLAEKRGYVRTIPYGAPLLFALALVRALSPLTLSQTWTTAAIAAPTPHAHARVTHREW